MLSGLAIIYVNMLNKANTMQQVHKRFKEWAIQSELYEVVTDTNKT